MSISVAQAAGAHLKVFISYSRRNAAAADALVDALTARGFGVTIDRRDLEFGEKWQAELAEFIRMSDTVIWLLSEASIQSKWVNWVEDETVNAGLEMITNSITTIEFSPRCQRPSRTYGSGLSS